MILRPARGSSLAAGDSLGSCLVVIRGSEFGSWPTDLDQPLL